MATKCFIGLGNPRKEYERTRHNAGFMAADALVRHWGLSWRADPARQSLVAEGNIDGVKVVVVKPQTYMNHSGEAVRAMMDYLHLSADDLVVITDDVSLPIGTVRVRREGSAGGHNGMKSLIDHIGSQSFLRIKIGVNPPPDRVPLEVYVLERFQKEEHGVIDRATAKVVEILNDPAQVLEETTYTV